MENDHSKTGPKPDRPKTNPSHDEAKRDRTNQKSGMLNRNDTVDQEDAIIAMKKLDDFLANQKLTKSSDDVQTHAKIPKKRG